MHNLFIFIVQACKIVCAVCFMKFIYTHTNAYTFLTSDKEMFFKQKKENVNEN